MPYYLHLRGPFGRQSDHEPYETLMAAQKDAEAGAKQAVGDAVKAGASLHKATAEKAFEIVDDAGTVVATFTFFDLINATE